MSETCANCPHPLMDHEHYGCELCECDRPYGRKPATATNHANGSHDA